MSQPCNSRRCTQDWNGPHHADSRRCFDLWTGVGLGLRRGRKSGDIADRRANTLEILFLGLALSTELMEEAMPAARIISITAAIALLLPIGAVLAAPITTLSPAVVKGFFAFGLIALLYLVTEELLVRGPRSTRAAMDHSDVLRRFSAAVSARRGYRIKLRH